MVRERKLLRGFTLIEVTIALALFAVSIMILTQSFMNGMYLKMSLKKEDKRPLMYEMIRSALMQMNRESVASFHKFFYPSGDESFSWQGKIDASDCLSLFKVIVKINDEPDENVFWVRRPDWVSESEMRLSFSKIINAMEQKNAKF